MLLADAHSMVVDGRRVLHTGARVGCLELQPMINILGLDGGEHPLTPQDANASVIASQSSFGANFAT